MDFAEALDATLKHFEITGRELAAQSGVTEASISRFRRGERDIQAETLEKLLSSLPNQAKQYFFFNCLMPDLDNEAIGTLLQAIGVKMRNDAKTKKKQRLKIPA